MLFELTLDACAHGGLFGQGGPLPVKAEALATDAALDILVFV
jgi:hypothetical protein